MVGTATFVLCGVEEKSCVRLLITDQSLTVSLCVLDGNFGLFGLIIKVMKARSLRAESNPLKIERKLESFFCEGD